MRSSIAQLVHDDDFYVLGSFAPCDVVLKLEGFNPAGSIKLKTALGLVEDLEQRGTIRKDSILIESSSGNLGVALSAIAAERGYRFVCIVDPNTSRANINIMKAFGADVIVVTEPDRNGGYLESRLAFIREVMDNDERYLWLNQYANSANPEIHRNTTARSIADRFPRIDYLFVGAGTTGTLMGCLGYFREKRPRTHVVAVDSVGSITFGHDPSRRLIPGLGTSRIPEIFDPSQVACTRMIPEARTVAMCRHVARTYGLLLGGSSGTVLSAVADMTSSFHPNDVVVAIAPDLGERYLDTIYDDAWVSRNFGAQEPTHGVRWSP